MFNSALWKTRKTNGRDETQAVLSTKSEVTNLYDMFKPEKINGIYVDRT